MSTEGPHKYGRTNVFVCVCDQEWSPSHNLKSLKKKQMAAREAMARQTTLSDAEQSSVESSVIRSEVKDHPGLYVVARPL